MVRPTAPCAQFHRQRVQIHAVQAALDDVALELRTQRLFKAFVGGVELQQFVAQQLRDLAVGHARHAAVFGALDQLVVV
jgi:DNA-binding FrmR family transcriptional regulator